MRFGELVRVSREVAATRSRSRKLELLSEAIERLDDAELEAGIAFLSGEPRQDRLEVGWATVGGLDVPPATAATLELREVDEALARVAGEAGAGSTTARRAALESLFARATAAEQEHLRGLVLRELRQGALAGLVTQAIARATGASEPAVRRAAMLRADLADVTRAARAGGDAALADVRLQLFRPLQPMLAQSAGDVDGVDRPTIVDVKLDGARVQVHRDGDEVRVYTRNLRDVTARVPEVVAAAHRLGLDRGVLDGEAIALRGDGRPEPFQVTMARFSSDDAGSAAPSTPLTVAFFDVLHADGEDVLDLPLERRLEVLDTVVPADLRVDRIRTAEADDVRAFLRRTLDAGHEGIMLKDPEAVYEAGRRGAGWRKVKPVHTLDLVVLAAEWGSGRRRGWLSNLHLGARDPDADAGSPGGGFVMLGKTFKGLTDETLAWQTERLLALEERRTRSTVHVRPEFVVEIAFDGVQASPRYPGGVTLRFARVKGYRPDKAAHEADTIATVHDIHAGRRRPVV